MELSGTINRSITLSGSMIARGLDGRGIVSIAKTGTSGLVDTYTITYTDATTSTFTVTNGANGQITATSFAEEFSSSKAYAAGDYVVYSGQLYQFTTAHAAGAWNASHATAVQIADQVSELKSALDAYPNILPNGYTQLKWIESDGTQRINTGVNFTAMFGFEIDFICYNQIKWDTGYGCILGSRKGSQNEELDLNTFKVNNLDGGIFRYGTNLQTSGNITPGTRQKIKWMNGELTVDGESKGTFTTNVTDNGKPIFLFALNNNGAIAQNSKVRLYSAKFYNGDTVVRNFVPAMLSVDGTCGLYDTVTDVFYKSLNGNAFTFEGYFSEVNYVDNIIAVNGLRISELLTNNYYISADGTSAVTNSDNRITDFIKIKKGQTVFYNGIYVSSAAKAIAFYSDKDYTTFITGVNGLGYNVAPVEGSYTATQDCYVVVGCRQEYRQYARLYFNDFSDGDNVRYEYLLNMIVDAAYSTGLIPEYWNTEIATSEASFIANEKTASPNSVSFAFVTDVHWGTNAQKSPAIMNKLMRDLDIDMLVCGGDIVTSKNNTQNGAIDLLTDFYKRFDTPVFATIGNHDNNSDHQTDTSLFLSSGTLYGRITKQTEKIKDSQTFHDIGCTYFDNESQKVRFIQFDSGTPMYNDGESVTVDTDILRPNIQKAGQLVAELDSDWTVVLFTHQYWNPAPSGTEVYANSLVNYGIQAYILDVTHSATIACIVTGHIHRDKTATMTNTAGTETVRLIGTTTDNCSASQNQYGGPSMSLGTNTEQAIDLFQIDTENKTIKITRVGAGSDRNYTY